MVRGGLFGSVEVCGSSVHSVRFGQLLVTLCTSTHCQCNESVHRKEQLLFTPFMTVYGDS